ncbi:hypothetical protein GA0070213_102295 [Micromonospora humi]|uniref:NUDIX domain-containing protein n=1 Tax=Micromonospora humi TaxID=745366 RepID=A0A1C5H6J4_9ACTN|nr:hypothetical protein GA0070213_102295 [Micromonospora humi]
MSDRPPCLVERDSAYVEYQLLISVKLVVDHHGRVPLLKNEHGEWELPGGRAGGRRDTRGRGASRDR